MPGRWAGSGQPGRIPEAAASSAGGGRIGARVDGAAPRRLGRVPRAPRRAGGSGGRGPCRLSRAVSSRPRCGGCRARIARPHQKSPTEVPVRRATRQTAVGGPDNLGGYIRRKTSNLKRPRKNASLRIATGTPRGGAEWYLGGASCLSKPPSLLINSSGRCAGRVGATTGSFNGGGTSPPKPSRV